MRTSGLLLFCSRIAARTVWCDVLKARMRCQREDRDSSAEVSGRPEGLHYDEVENVLKVRTTLAERG
jgi:hypothetical protein